MPLTEENVFGVWIVARNGPLVSVIANQVNATFEWFLLPITSELLAPVIFRQLKRTGQLWYLFVFIPFALAWWAWGMVVVMDMISRA